MWFSLFMLCVFGFFEFIFFFFATLFGLFCLAKSQDNRKKDSHWPSCFDAEEYFLRWSQVKNNCFVKSEDAQGNCRTKQIAEHVKNFFHLINLHSMDKFRFLSLSLSISPFSLWNDITFSCCKHFLIPAGHNLCSNSVHLYLLVVVGHNRPK